MTRLRTFCFALAAIGFAGGTAVAQSTTSDPAAQPSKGNQDTTGKATPSMGNSNDMSATPNTPAMKMSPMDTKTMNACQAMSHDAMMVDTKCKDLMARHPDKMNSDGTMKNGPSPH